MYHPMSYINYFFKNNVYIETMFDKIRENNLYIVDSHRLFTVEILTYYRTNTHLYNYNFAYLNKINNYQSYALVP